MTDGDRGSGIRLYAILSRESPHAVVFRRGPSKRVLLIRWNTSDDTMEEGQWLKGRVYERRCDLSPDGRLLVYFAANHRKPFYSWTAISQPPYFTALALWPKGDGWGGGGLFTSGDQLLLNHRENEMQLAPESEIPRWLRVTPFGRHSGWGEDDPIWSERMRRDGWTLISEGQERRHASDAKVWITYEPPIVREKPHPKRGAHFVLRSMINGLKEREGPWYLTDHSVCDGRGRELISLPRSDWADWLPSGDLVYATDGKLFRVRQTAGGFAFEERPHLIADLSDRVFAERKAPPGALGWPARTPSRG